jgi:hypothetical protein
MRSVAFAGVTSRMLLPLVCADDATVVGANKERPDLLAYQWLDRPDATVHQVDITVDGEVVNSREELLLIVHALRASGGLSCRLDRVQHQ